MKKFMDISALSCIGILMLSGCVEENFEKPGIPEGDGIVFGATAGYAGGPGTKTEYGDYNYENGQKVSQEINWVSNDQVEIYSPASPITQKVVYTVATGGQSTTTLVARENGLQWTSSDETQDFYAIYPAISSIQNEAVQRLTSFTNGVFTGYVPINQQHTITKGSGGYIAKPNMDYLYMTAIEKIPVPTGDASQDGISLHFVPLTTTLEVTIEGPTQAPLASMNVRCGGVAVAGQFKCDLVNGELDSDGYPVCVSEQQHTTNDYVTVSLYYQDGDIQKPLELAAGESVTLNVFLLPTADLNNISISVAGFNSASKSMSLTHNGAKITLSPHKKTCVTVPAPPIGPGETNTWITSLPDNVLISQLSIPGTANTFSYNYTGSNPDWYQSQTEDFDIQWNAGIRCFELKGPETTGDLAETILQCNRTDVGTSFGDAVQAIWTKVQESPGEFAIVIPAYESGSGHSISGADSPAIKYAKALNTFFANHADYQYVTYRRNLTVGEARGKLLFITRITSEEDGELMFDPGTTNVAENWPTPAQGVVINEWGSLKDLWKRRGYEINGNLVSDWADDWGTGSNNSMEYYMINGNRASDYVPSLPERNDNSVNFYHATLREGGSTTLKGAYIQDWNRVVPAIKNYKLYDNYKNDKEWWQIRDNWVFDFSAYVYWPESMTEKMSDVWNTFMKAIEDNNNKQGEAFYINNLDGYYVDENIPLSYTPYVNRRNESYTGKDGNGGGSVPYSTGGTAGNIAAYATDINSYFYNEILNYGVDNIYGPMNIVLIPRAYADDAGKYLPSVIINNNFRFPLITSDDVQAASEYDASYSAGGNVWE